MSTSQNPRFQGTSLRIKDPQVSVPFYQSNFGMTLIDSYDFPEQKFSVYVLATLAPDQAGKVPDGPPGSDEAHRFLWSDAAGTTLELVHAHGSEDDPNFSVNNGNVEPHRGFGHIAFNVEDVYKSCEALEAAGCKFQKKPDEGRMKGLAFALDPDGYWIELIKKTTVVPGVPASHLSRPNLSQTMLRVKDPEKSLSFYRSLLGMVLLWERHFESAAFSLYFLASRQSLPEGFDIEKHDPRDDAMGGALAKGAMQDAVIELTHNHGTEKPDSDFAGYHNGNDEPRGFSHVTFLVDDLSSACDQLTEAGVSWRDGHSKSFAYALDPDGYSVKIAPRGMKM